jgi:hypothetical protein
MSADPYAAQTDLPGLLKDPRRFPADHAGQEEDEKKHQDNEGKFLQGLFLSHDGEPGRPPLQSFAHRINLISYADLFVPPVIYMDNGVNALDPFLIRDFMKLFG